MTTFNPELVVKILDACEALDLNEEEAHLHLLGAVRSLTPSVEMSCETLRMLQPDSVL